ncbi:hypothetical protein EG329_011336 [Mollisiaceae sp. DMI_Dod_QoI]|nr:hypothetical protein EG329_011336 [Helotiales sp. DMI_Dod_QoI]
MRLFQILTCSSAVSAFNSLPDIFQRHKRQACQVFTIVEYPCVVQTWVSSNTALWIESCTTSINITNAPTSLSTTITSTTTLGLTSTTLTTTVTLSVHSTSTLSATLTLSGSAQSTSTSQSSTTRTAPLPGTSTSTSPEAWINPPVSAPTSTTLTGELIPTNGVNPTSPIMSIVEPVPTWEYTPSNTISMMASATPPSCIPPSTSGYPSADYIPANTTYIIQVTGLEGLTCYLLSMGGLTSNPSLAVQVFFYDGILFALDPNFGVGWYATTIVTGDAAFALQQYSSISTSIARTFTTVPNSPLSLAWVNCAFDNPNVVFVFNAVDSLVHSIFGGYAGSPSDITYVGLDLIPLYS